MYQTTRPYALHRILPWALSLALVLTGGCVGTRDEMAADKVADVRPLESPQPAPWDLSTPVAAVDSYLRWVSYSYLMANSDIPTATMTPDEGVRVDSYIELNRQDNRAIEQALVRFTVVDAVTAEPTATVTAVEEWRYRYFALDTLTYTSDELAASYETTYTVLLQPDGSWLVDSVEAFSSADIR